MATAIKVKPFAWQRPQGGGNRLARQGDRTCANGASGPLWTLLGDSSKLHRLTSYAWQKADPTLCHSAGTNVFSRAVKRRSITLVIYRVSTYGDGFLLGIDRQQLGYGMILGTAP